MPFNRVGMLAGRAQEQKRQLAQELTTAFVKVVGGTSQTVHVVMTDVDKGNWSSSGELCSGKFPD